MDYKALWDRAAGVWQDFWDGWTVTGRMRIEQRRQQALEAANHGRQGRFDLHEEGAPITERVDSVSLERLIEVPGLMTATRHSLRGAVTGVEVAFQYFSEIESRTYSLKPEGGLQDDELNRTTLAWKSHRWTASELKHLHKHKRSFKPNPVIVANLERNVTNSAFKAAGFDPEDAGGYLDHIKALESELRAPYFLFRDHGRADPVSALTQRQRIARARSPMRTMAHAGTSRTLFDYGIDPGAEMPLGEALTTSLIELAHVSRVTGYGAESAANLVKLYLAASGVTGFRDDQDAIGARRQNWFRIATEQAATLMATVYHHRFVDSDGQEVPRITAREFGAVVAPGISGYAEAFRRYRIREEQAAERSSLYTNPLESLTGQELLQRMDSRVTGIVMRALLDARRNGVDVEAYFRQTFDGDNNPYERAEREVMEGGADTGVTQFAFNAVELQKLGSVPQPSNPSPTNDPKGIKVPGGLYTARTIEKTPTNPLE